MNTERNYNTSCALEDRIYTFCGFNNGIHLNCIEWISAPSVISGESLDTNYWELIRPSHHDFRPRENPMVCPISPTELIIMGGDKYFSGRMGDAYIFDVLNLRTTRIFENMDFRFRSHGN